MVVGEFGELETTEYPPRKHAPSGKQRRAMPRECCVEVVEEAAASSVVSQSESGSAKRLSQAFLI